MNLIHAEILKKDYHIGDITINAIREVDFSIESASFVSFVGPSGSGKTTLLNMIGCVDVPTKGTVLVDGQTTTELGDKARTHLRLDKLGFIFQTFNLIPVLTAAQNVEFPLLLQGKMSKAERNKRVAELIELVDLQPQIKQRPNELSGGQRQRVAIARALVTKPAIVLADEPTANLDSVTGQNIIDLMKDLNKQSQTTFIFSTHDHRVMDQARRVVQIIDGKVASDKQGNGQAPAAPAGQSALQRQT
jgi:putative ABC transport system ATP-binding protein